MKHDAYHPIRSAGWQDYELLDSGNSRKLERFGHIILDRFEPEALWPPKLKSTAWQEAHQRYILDLKKNSGRWEVVKEGQAEWTIKLDQLRIALALSASRHIGIFPEQLENWRWLQEQLLNKNKPARVLNLFAYTGIASLYCAKAGAHVTHVDASRAAIEMAKNNQILSKLQHQQIRWIKEDAMKFISREIRRGVKYDAIILDPPVFGRGPKGEVWKFEKMIEKLLGSIQQILSEKSSLFLLTAYNVNMNINNLEKLVRNQIAFSGERFEFGPISQLEKSGGREINQAIYFRQSFNT